MDLAAHLGMTVARLQAEMDIRELALWKIKWSVDPWGDMRADLRSGLLCSVIANVNRDSQKRSKPFTPIDFLLFKRDDAEEEAAPKRATIQPETVAWFEAIAAQHLVKPPKRKTNGT